MTAPNGSPTAPPVPAAGLDPTRAPRTELGRPANMQVVYSTRGAKQWQPKYADPNPALRFPLSCQVFDVMLRTDDQVGSVLNAINLPILDAPWDLVTDGVAPDVVDLVRNEIGLPEPGKTLTQRVRGQSGIVFAEHLREALDCLPFGFMAFEQSYSTTFPGDRGHPSAGRWLTQPCAHLAKLAARSPATVRRIRLAADGGLVSLIQAPPEGEPDWFNRPDGEPGIEIPVNRLVMYTNDRKGADWTGVSILRTAYRPWKIKEQLCRLDALAAERNSMGLPVVYYNEATIGEDRALEIATQARAGSEAGMALPEGVRFELVGVSGSVPDLTPKIAAYDQAIGRASLAMFLNLGHDNGARSLGDTFLAFFTRAEQAVANALARIFTEHVIRDLVEWNCGPEEPYPILTPGEITAEMALAPEGLKALIEADVIRPDDVLEESTRRRYRLPTPDASSSRKKEEPKPKPPTADNGLPTDGLPGPGNPFAPPAPEPPPPAKDAKGGGKGGAKGDAEDDEDAEEAAEATVPAGAQRVRSYVRRAPVRAEASLAGYAAWLAGQVAVEAPDDVGGR